MDEWMLNDLLECSVCLERLDTSSKVLPCQHTFCRKCLEEIVSTHKELRCPECRILVELRIDDLPPNVLLMRILEGMRNAPKKKGGSSTASTSARPMPTMLQQQGFPSNPHTQQQSPGHQHHHRAYLAPHPAAREHHSIRSHHSPKQVVVPNQPCAKALFNYQSRVQGDLNFKKGDIITLKKKIDANWYEGSLGGNCGVFPSSYVQVITPLPSHIPQCKALYDFKMTNDDEEGCLTFKKGEILTVIRRVDENWAEGKLSDRIGIFPLAFVELNDVARALVKLSTNSQPGPSRVAPPTPTSEDATPLIPTDHMITTPANLMANLHFSSPSFHSTPPSQASTAIATTTVSSSHPSMPLQANQMVGNAGPHHHHRHAHHRHHHGQQQPVAPQQQPTPSTTVASTPLSSSMSSSTSSSPTSSTSSTPSSSSSTTATNSPSSPASPPPPPPPPPLPPSSVSTTTSEPQRGTPPALSPSQQYQREKRHSFNVLHSNQSMPQPTTHRHSAEILSPTATSTAGHLPDDQAQGQEGQSDCSSSSQSKNSQHRHKRSGSDLTSTPPSSNPDQSSNVMLPATYVALYPYKPQKADELELRKGAVYTVTEKCQDGWFKGTSMRTHKCGVFPGNYVALMRPPAPPPPYNQLQNQLNGSSAPIETRLPSSTSSPSRPGNHHSSSQAAAPSTSSRIPVASSISSSVQSFSRGKPSAQGSNAADGRLFAETASPHGNVAPPKPPRPHSPHHSVNSPHDHQTQSLPVSSPPPELPPRSSTPPPFSHHFPSLTPPTPLNSVGTSSSWHPSGHQISVEGLGNRGSSGCNTLSTAVTPPPNVSVGSSSSSTTPPGPSTRPSVNTPTQFTEKSRDRKERGGVSLMRRLTSMKSKSKSPPLAPSYSMDNPVFEDGCLAQPIPQSRPSAQMLSMATQQVSPSTHSVHVRSGSCPSQLLQAIPSDGMTSEPKHHHRLLCSESQRQKHKERPSVALFGSRSTSGAIAGQENVASGGSSSGGHRKSNSLDAGTCLSASGDSIKKSKQLVPPIKERFRCIVAYPPNSEYELELKVGDVIYVHRKREDGWYKGTLLRTGRTGLFPASFVEAF